MAKNDKVTLIVGTGPEGMPVTKEASAPVIISASRSTDIPAFYGEWLAERLRRGFCVWYNPFNRRPSWISFERTRAFVFWTKNPAPFIPLLPEFDKRGIGYYFQYTLNDYEREGFEPGLPPLAERIAAFKRLSDMLGPERVIWRFDPIILGPALSPRDVLMKIWNIGKALHGRTKRLVFSFIDVAAYRKVQINMAKTRFFTRDNVFSAEANAVQIRELCEGLVKMRERWHSEGWDIALATCAEGVDLARYGIEHNRCIDDVLLRRLFPHDAALMEYLGAKPARPPQGSLVELPSVPAAPQEILPNPKLKDKGQRGTCGCIAAKDIGMYDTCAHFCAYCYANTSVEAVRRNRARHTPSCESILAAEYASGAEPAAGTKKE